MSESIKINKGSLWYCKSCGKDCSEDPKDYYMLKDEVWENINPEIQGMLCIDCVEGRLGRKLIKEDVMDCGLTRVLNPYTSIFFNEIQ